jgi:hypothetical protein
MAETEYLNHFAAFFAGGDHRVTFFKRGSHRLFYQHVLPGIEKINRDLRVAERRGAYADKIDVLRVKDFLIRRAYLSAEIAVLVFLSAFSGKISTRWVILHLPGKARYPSICCAEILPVPIIATLIILSPCFHVVNKLIFRQAWEFFNTFSYFILSAILLIKE